MKTMQRYIFICYKTYFCDKYFIQFCLFNTIVQQHYTMKNSKTTHIYMSCLTVFQHIN